MQTLIDANVILRYILNDIAEQAQIAKKLIDAGAFTLPEIIAEVVYVLHRVYEMPRAVIFDCLLPTLARISINDKKVVVRALQLYSETSFDFVDCELLAHKEILGESIFSFDKKLMKKLRQLLTILFSAGLRRF